MLLLRLFALCATQWWAGLALAHDLWLEPSTHEPAIGQAVGVTVRIGEHFKGDAIGMAGVPIRELFVADGAGRRAVQVLRGRSPSLLLRTPRAGPQVLAYRSHPIDIQIAAGIFNKYLAEEGLETVAEVRRAKGLTDAEGTEAYVRCAKALLLAGAGDADAALKDEVLGLPLELVAREPIGAATREARFQLLFEGQPVAGVLVTAINEAKPSAIQALRSNADGEVNFRLEPGARWLVKAVHMRAAPQPTSPGAAQWHSWWASLTFALPAGRAAGKSAG